MVPVTFLQVDLDRDLSFSRLFDSMLEAGWLARRADGIGAILCDLDGTYEWLYRRESELASLRSQLQNRFSEGWTVGVVLWWRDPSNVSVNLVLRPHGHISFMIGAERKELNELPELADASWYLSRLLPALTRVDREASILNVQWSEVW